MGSAGWDDTPGRSRSARGRRPLDDDRREARDARGYDRQDRGSGRSGRDDMTRGSASSWERPRSPGRDDDRRGSSGGHPARRDDARGYDRADPNRPGRGRGYERDDSDGRSSRAGDRAMRGPRPPREDTWEPGRSRSGAGGPGNSGARHRAPARGGVWGDEGQSPRGGRRPGPGGSDPRAGKIGARTGMRDPRALRRGLVPEDDEPEAKKGGFGAGQAFLVIVLMLILGAGGAFGYWKLSTPKVPADKIAPTDSGGNQNASPAASPSASPASSPSATTAPKAQAPVVWIGAA